jgi:CO/xanthine dehydrogenase Mo-binding subunit
MTATETNRSSVDASSVANASLLTGKGRSSTTWRRRDIVDDPRPQRTRTRRSRIDIGGEALEGVVAVLEGAAAVWLAGHGGHEEPAALSSHRHSVLQGDGVAVVIATSRPIAKDAAELVEVDYEPLPVSVDI